jgi:hypothetical protein
MPWVPLSSEYSFCLYPAEPLVIASNEREIRIGCLVLWLSGYRMMASGARRSTVSFTLRGSLPLFKACQRRLIELTPGLPTLWVMMGALYSFFDAIQHYAGRRLPHQRLSRRLPSCTLPVQRT